MGLHRNGLQPLLRRIMPLVLASYGAAADSHEVSADTQPERSEAIDRVWAGHAVRFALVTDARRIVVAYYDANRQLAVASRPRDRAAGWVYHRLDSWTGWDSHNYVAAAVDGAGHVHVVANLHNDPLVYYRTTIPGDVRTLVRVAAMVDPQRERRMTYPVFLRDAAGWLIFKYRDGGSGNGNELYNAYDPATRRWRSLLDTPLADGEGRRNAYFVGPTAGPDGRFHLAWVWRDTPDAATNHDLSYAVSDDLVAWRRSDGRAVRLPMTLAGAEIVDPVPAGGGMINNNTVIGFDRERRPVITYHKFDARGDTQIYLARREAQGWRIAQASRWRGFRWAFGGGGSLDSRLFVEGAVPDAPGRLRVRVERDGRPIDLIVDERDLAPVAERPAVTLARRLVARMPLPPGMMMNTVSGDGVSIAWATRPPNRDLPTTDIPQPTTLHLVQGQ